MEILDRDRWEAQKAELKADGEVGESVLGFLEAWADAAEEKMEAAIREAFDITWMDALNATLETTEQALSYRLTVGLLGSVLVLLAANWVYGEQLREDMTPVEWRLMVDVLQTKLDVLQAQAEATGE